MTSFFGQVSRYPQGHNNLTCRLVLDII